jgi:hypothetical protein
VQKEFWSNFYSRLDRNNLGTNTVFYNIALFMLSCIELGFTSKYVYGNIEQVGARPMAIILGIEFGLYPLVSRPLIAMKY